MILECKFTAPIARTMQEDYVRELTIDIHCFSEEVLHPDILPHAKAILDAAVDLLGQDALIVMWRGLGNVPDADLAEIGFRKIAGTELICRQSTLRSRFSEQYPRGQDVDVVGRPEFEQWVLEQWQKEELD